MKNKLITQFEKRVWSGAKKLAEFRAGDTVRVHYKIQEGADKSKFRIQLFEGVVTRFRKGTADGSFTVRKISAGGVGVERVFPVYSPYVDKVDVIASGIVRRARLYYLRDLAGKAARIRSKYVSKKLDAVVAAEDYHKDQATELAPESK
ncbi:50S ribosomal protein L19 [bacterium]|nr:50S ribosomal protein L19 [bacterium]